MNRAKRELEILKARSLEFQRSYKRLAGMEYCGKLVAGVQMGFGLAKTKRKSIYAGSYFNGNRQGFGICINKEIGQIYVGFW